MDDLVVVEEGLVPVYQDQSERMVVNARELHFVLGSRWKFADWIKERISKYGFSEGEDYEVIQEIQNNRQGGRPFVNYLLTIDVAKEIAMVENNEKGRQVRKYFIECEKRLRQVAPVTVDEAVAGALADPRATAQMLLALADVREENTTLKVQVSTLEQTKKVLKSSVATLKLNEMRNKPKVTFADAVEVSKSSILIGDLAKLIKQNGVDIGQKRLFEWLRENGYLMKQGSSWNMPTQKSMELGLFEVKEHLVQKPDGSSITKRTTKVTGKGQVYFINKFLTNKSEDYNGIIPKDFSPRELSSDEYERIANGDC